MENVQESVTAKISQNPKFQTLVNRRSRFAWTLSAIVLVVFYGFVMIVAFNPAALGASLTGYVVRHRRLRRRPVHVHLVLAADRVLRVSRQ